VADLFTIYVTCNLMWWIVLITFFFTFWFWVFCISMKDVRTKSRKIDLLPPLSVQTHHKFQKNPMFFAPKSADVHIWRSPLVRIGQPPSDCSCPLWMAPYSNCCCLVDFIKEIPTKSINILRQSYANQIFLLTLKKSKVKYNYTFGYVNKWCDFNLNWYQTKAILRLSFLLCSWRFRRMISWGLTITIISNCCSKVVYTNELK